MARHHLVYLNAHLATPANNDMALQHDTLAADAVLLMQSAQWQNWLDAWLTAQPVAVFRL